MVVIEKFDNGSWRPAMLMCKNDRERLSGISYGMIKIHKEYVEIGFDGRTLVSANFKESRYLSAHFFDRDRKDHVALYINAHNTFLKSGMLPSEMWEIISGSQNYTIHNRNII